MENLIEELTKVNPANLSEEGLKLFNKIMEIIDRNQELEKQVVLVPEGTTFLAIPKNMILKSKVEEKKEEALKRFNELHAKHYRDCGIAENKEKAKIELCEELLQEGDK